MPRKRIISTFIEVQISIDLPEETINMIEARVNAAIETLKDLPVTLLIDDDYSKELAKRTADRVFDELAKNPKKP